MEGFDRGALGRKKLDLPRRDPSSSIKTMEELGEELLGEARSQKRVAQLKKGISLSADTE